MDTKLKGYTATCCKRRFAVEIENDVYCPYCGKITRIVPNPNKKKVN
jgi:rRNA maturation endonuclease Nob1